MRLHRFVLLAIAVACFSGPIFAGDLGITLDLPQPSYVQGAPINCRLIWENMSDRSLMLAYDPSLRSPLVHLRVSGPIDKNCVRGDFVPEWVVGAHTTLRPHEQAIRSLDLVAHGLVAPGAYEVWVEYDSTALDSLWSSYGVQRTRAESNHLKIQIVAPTGVDAQVFASHHNDCNQLTMPPEDILKASPTSTYAAYVIYGRLQGFADGDFTDPKFLRSLQTSRFLQNSYPTESGWVPLEGANAAAWWSKWISIILKNHPDIWFADELRLKLAVDQVALKNYQTGAADLEALSKQAKPEVAQKAQSILDAMKQKGWIKG